MAANVIYRDFKKARTFVRSLGFQRQQDWLDYCKSGKKPKDIPSNPNKTYKNLGYINMGDWIGTGNIATNNREYVSYEEFKKFIRKNNIKSQSQWKLFVKEQKKLNNFPHNIPSNAFTTYADEWEGWGIITGTNRVADHLRKYTTYDELKELIKPFNFTKMVEYHEWWDKTKPSNIPKTPDEKFKNDGWISWPEFFGIIGNGAHTWNKHTMLAYVKSMRSALIHLDRIILLDILETSKFAVWLKKNGKFAPLTATSVGSEDAEKIVDTIIDDIEKSSEEDVIVAQEEIAETNPNVEEVEEILIEQQETTEEEPTIVPTINEMDELNYFDDPMVLKSISTEETFDFYQKYYENKVWNGIINLRIDINKYDREKSNDFKRKIMDNVLEEYNEAVDFKLINDFKSIDSNGKKIDLSLMQKLIAIRFRKENFYGNWSDTGTGKTLASLYAGRELGCKNTIIVCLNSTVNGWRDEINKYFKNSNVFTKFNFEDKYNINLPKNQFNYILLNVETFQQANIDEFIYNLINNNEFDYVIIDEVQSVKTRDDENVSIRTRSILKLIQSLRNKKEDFKLMVMSATPIINNFVEPKNLIELMTGIEHNDINTSENITNGLQLFKFLTRYGCRFKSKKITKVINLELDVDGSDINLRDYDLSQNDYLKMEQILLNHKLNSVLPHIVKGKTIIYIQYVQGIDYKIKKFLKQNGLTSGFFTGKDKNGLEDFIGGNVDVLIGSQPITTGVNGLQTKANVLIEIILPWTKADRTQFHGRVVNRTGTTFKEVTIITPLVKLYDGDDEIEYDKRRLSVLKRKGMLTDMVLDGIVPSGKLPPRKKLLAEVLEHFDAFEESVKSDEQKIIKRRKLDIDLNFEFEESQQRKLGDFSEMNRNWNVSNSNTTHQRLTEEPNEWYYYHKLYREARQSWSEIPFIEIAKKIKRADYVVGDFGCGENLLKNEISNQVLSFDHVAIDDTVTACDISNLPLEDSTLDIVVLSLAMMHVNCEEYIIQAYRTLKVGGIIHIAEPQSRWSGNVNELKELLERFGFKCFDFNRTESFIYIDGIKI